MIRLVRTLGRSIELQVDPKGVMRLIDVSKTLLSQRGAFVEATLDLSIPTKNNQTRLREGILSLAFGPDTIQAAKNGLIWLFEDDDDVHTLQEAMTYQQNNGCFPVAEFMWVQSGTRWKDDMVYFRYVESC